MGARDFSSGFSRPDRVIDNDAPGAMRREFIDFVFSVSERIRFGHPQPHTLYMMIIQSLGSGAAANPMSGYRAKAAQELVLADWTRFYDVVLRLWPEFASQGYGDQYSVGVNQILSGHGVVWELNTDGKLERVLPASIRVEVVAAIDELRRPGFEGALQTFNLAKDAFDARPRRDRDAGANAFDGMEAAAKARFAMPTATFGAVLDSNPCRGAVSEDIRRVLRQLEVVRHHHLGHGTTQPLQLTANEVDFVYVACAAGARLFARLP